MPVIYKIESPSGKVYIGQSWNYKKRYSNYKNTPPSSQKAIYNSIVKYGWDSHSMEIVHTLTEDVTQEVLDTYEIFYWQQYKDCGVEMLNIKEPGSQGRQTKESIEKTAAKKRGIKLTEDHKRKISEGNKGKVLSEETRKKIGNAHRGKKESEQTAANHIGKKLSQETKDKLRSLYKGKTFEEVYGKEKATEMRQKMKTVPMGFPPKKVLCVETNVVYNSAKHAAKELGVCRTSITLNILGKTNKSRKGFTFKYI